ncbi:MAG: hypothetical protein WBJ77_03295, partial [Bacillota bacterium]
VSRSYLAALEANLRRETVDLILSKARSDGTLAHALKQLSEGKTYPAALAKQLVKTYLIRRND